MKSLSKRAPLSAQELKQRKRYMQATIVTCLSLAMIGGVIHVVELGATRMQDMKHLASYDLKDELSKVRAAGEDIALHEAHEAGLAPDDANTLIDVEQMLSREQWSDLSTMVKVPAGRFTMGTNLAAADAQDKPAHSASLPDFYIDKYLITQAQYARFVILTHHRAPLNWKNARIIPADALQPVTMVTWYDADAYCKWVKKTLPSEEEFEKAGRGPDARRWPWGNQMDATRLNTYYSVGSASPVNRYPQGASPYGALDMAGNVSEWVADDFKPYEGSLAPQDLFVAKQSVQTNAQDRNLKISDQKIVSRQYKVMRGGSWNGDPFSTSLFHRNFSLPNHTSDFFGFRCASLTNQQP